MILSPTEYRRYERHLERNPPQRGCGCSSHDAIRCNQQGCRAEFCEHHAEELLYLCEECKRLYCAQHTVMVGDLPECLRCNRKLMAEIGVAA